ncbi:hypothetical protein RCT08_09800 [Escherichia marmotae]|nr:hypothetical protein [Escherichia marmotae]MED8860075.1 hypothetical protein [Escherichia marmotae]MED9055145.1 hypothetical protein [Escherichia marmotae]MED9779406.1 hypothetical protein [Escherichia marmotae]
MPDADCRMLIAGCDADASYPAYRVLSGLARLIRPGASYQAYMFPP